MLFLTVVIPIELPPPVINWVPIMYDTVMVGADDDLIACIIVEARDEIIDMMRFRNMRTEFLTNQLSAELTAVAIKKFQVLPNLSVQLSNLDQVQILLDAGALIYILIVDLCFHH